MLLLNRVIYKDGTLYTDNSRELSDIAANNVDFDVSPGSSAIYIGSDLPFNHRYFNVSTLNIEEGLVTVSIWDGSSFVPAVDVIDLTSSAGIPFAQDGLIMWSTDQSSGWARQDTTENISELSSFKIYNNYWVKIEFTASMAFSLNYVGHKFAKDSDLSSYYGDLNRATVREAFYEAVTATWNTVHITAAEEIIRDLRASKVVVSPNQILDPDTFRDAGIHKLAEIVYSSFGPSHADRVDFAVNKYKEALNKLVFNVDRNMDGKPQFSEKVREFRLRRQ